LGGSNNKLIKKGFCVRISFQQKQQQQQQHRGIGFTSMALNLISERLLDFKGKHCGHKKRKEELFIGSKNRKINKTFSLLRKSVFKEKAPKLKGSFF